MDIKKQFGLTIRRLRTNQEFPITQEELAEEAGISRKYYGDLEKGIRMPSLEIMMKLSHAFGMKFSDFCKAFESTLE